MWTDGLRAWYADHGRHQLPWRQTTEPWPVLVSEVMLQQTSVARVLPRWHAFLQRWPDPTACSRAPLAEILREWQGLGYPRRARALWLTAAHVAAGGWPVDEAGLLRLPGVGTYTARALLAFTDLGAEADASCSLAAPPRDVNLGRVAARAGLGRDPQAVAPGLLDDVLAAGRPRGMAMREYAYALFDVGAIHCRATPRCEGCALTAVCVWRAGDRIPTPTPRRQAPYRGSLRQLRGAILAAALQHPDANGIALRGLVAEVPGATDDRVAHALAGLIADGLLHHGNVPGRRAVRR